MRLAAVVVAAVLPVLWLLGWCWSSEWLLRHAEADLRRAAGDARVLYVRDGQYLAAYCAVPPRS